MNHTSSTLFMSQNILNFKFMKSLDDFISFIYLHTHASGSTSIPECDQLTSFFTYASCVPYIMIICEYLMICFSLIKHVHEISTY